MLGTIIDVRSDGDKLIFLVLLSDLSPLDGAKEVELVFLVGIDMEGVSLNNFKNRQISFDDMPQGYDIGILISPAMEMSCSGKGVILTRDGKVDPVNTEIIYSGILMIGSTSASNACRTVHVVSKGKVLECQIPITERNFGINKLHRKKVIVKVNVKNKRVHIYDEDLAIVGETL